MVESPTRIPSIAPITRDGALSSLLLIAILTAIVFLRNTFPFAFPTLYAEDAYWMGRLMNDGFWATVTTERVDFAVVGLILLDALSLQITRILFNYDITALPQVMAVVASIYLGIVAALPYLCLRDRIAPVYCLLISACIVLLPVGYHGDEIFGRVLNLGFYTTVIAQFVFYVLLYRCPPLWAQTALYVGALVLMWTFPPVIGQFALFCVFYCLSNSGQGRGHLGRAAAGFLLLFVAGLSGLSILAVTGSGGIVAPFDPNGLVEFVFARSTLFPVIAARYGMLTDGIVLIFFAVFLAVVAAYAFASRTAISRISDFRLFFIANFGLILAINLVMRRGFTGMYGTYTETFPDRYFTGLNIMFLTACLAVTFTVPVRWMRRVAGICVVAMIVSWLAFLPIFERGQPAVGDRRIGTLRDVICDRARGQGVLLPPSRPGVQSLAAYPLSPDYVWRVDVPQAVFDQTARLQCPL